MQRLVPARVSCLVAMVVVALSFAAQGCATTTRLPGVVTVEGYTASLIMLSPINALTEFNGVRLKEPLDGGWTGRVFVIPPGTHVVEIQSYWSEGWKGNDGKSPPEYTFVKLEFTAVADGEYKVLRVGAGGPGGMFLTRDPYILDVEANEIVSTVVATRSSEQEREDVLSLHRCQPPRACDAETGQR